MAPEQQHKPGLPLRSAWRGGTYDSRLTTSTMLVAMTAVLAMSLTLPFATPPIKKDVRTPSGQRSADNAPVAQDAQDVKIVAASPSLEVPCEEQTWPYLDRRCLKDGPPAPASSARATAAAQQKSAAEPLDPRNAVPVMVRSPSASDTQTNAGTAGSTETTGIAVKEDAGSAVSTRPTETTSAPDVAAAAGAAATTALARPETVRSSTPPSSAAPAESSAPKADAREGRKGRRAGKRISDPERIVRRWRELVYDLPGGGTRRVRIFPRGLF